MSVYLAKIVAHDYEISGNLPSMIAVCCLHVGLKICEQIKKTKLITEEVGKRLLSATSHLPEDILEVSKKVLYLAQNFES